MKYISSIFLIFILFSIHAQAFNKLEGQFFIETQGQTWQSFKKQTNPDQLWVKPGERYTLLGENKSGGDWVQVKTGSGPRWINKAQGRVVLNNKGYEGDIYTLALSWQPGFCEISKKRQLPECVNAEKNWVLHGLWPSSRKGPHPAYCGTARKHYACDYPPLGLDSNLLDSLMVVMPSVKSCRQRYQWNKHGSCSGLSPAKYFEDAINYTQWFRASPVAKTFVAHGGQKVSKKEVLGWFRAWGADGAVTLHCKEGIFQEVRLYFNRELEAKPSIEQLVRVPFHQQCGDKFTLQ